MDYITEAYSDVGYPLPLFFIIGFIGLLLAIFRPFIGYCFSVLLLSAKNFHAAVNTRLSITGEFLNFADLLFWISILSFIIHKLSVGKRILYPKVFIFLIILIFIATLQSFFIYGNEKFVLRSIWYILIFPSLFFVTFNMIDNEDKARKLFFSLFIGVSIATLQHFIFLIITILKGDTEINLLRTISYLPNGGYYLLASVIFSGNLFIKSRFLSRLFLSLIFAVLVSLIMNQTRQMYIVFILSIITMGFLVRNRIKISSNIKNILYILLVFFIFFFVVSNYEVRNIMIDTIETRTEFIRDKSNFEESYSTRKMGMETELRLWMDSFLVIGVGAAYPPELTEHTYVFITGALNHVAFSSYLAHFGLLGLFMYLIYLPISTIKISKFLINVLDPDKYAFKIALMCMSVSLMDLYNAFGSLLLTAPSCHIQAICYGAVWGIYLNNITRNKLNGLSEN